MLIIELAINEKPDKCESCPLRICTESGYYCAGDKDNRELSYDAWRPFWCPIKEIIEEGI